MPALVFVTFIPKSGSETRVLEILRVMVDKTRREPGNRRYDLYKANNAAGRLQYHLLEHYVDDAAVQAHRETEHYKEYRANIVPLLEQPIAVTLLDALDARGN
jgi:quinol monooxygenase YgiN